MTDGGVVRAYTYQNTGLTHSRTLMPLVDAMLRESEQSLADMDLLAVAAGPGSFTGLRIGVSALKGLAWAADKPCCGVSTLEAMAQNLRHMTGPSPCPSWRKSCKATPGPSWWWGTAPLCAAAFSPRRASPAAWPRPSW